MPPVSKEEETRARREIEGRAPAPTDSGPATGGEPKPSDHPPPAGPHASSELINPDATPGTGALPTPGDDDDVDSASS